jgi:DNA-binding SARP family transcriptional activator
MALEPVALASSAMLSLQVLGPVTLQRDGLGLPLTVRKCAALLVLLAVGGPISRPQVVALLWPALDQCQGRRNLRRELARLRELGAGAAVVADGDRLALDPAVAVDATAWDRLTDPDAALSLWRGPLADSLVVDEAPPFMDWLAVERERCHCRWREHLDASVEASLAAGCTQDALAKLDRLLADDPLQERHHRRVMRLLADSGRREDALARYRQCRDLLHAELGLAPTAETEALAAAVAGTIPADPGPALAVPLLPPISVSRSLLPMQSPARLPARLPFVGREDAVAWLERAWRAGGLILIEGEGGIGKSRLAVDFAAAHGPLALARCRPADAEVPLASLTRALRVLAGPAPDVASLPAWVSSELARLLPELGPVPLPLRSEPERARFGEAIAIAWRQWAEGSFDAVVLDDWHLADAASQSLLPAVAAARDGAEPLRVLVVYRPELNDAAARRLRRLRDAGAAHRLLEPLDDAAVLDLLQRLSGAAQPQRFARRLTHATGGHPFHIAETLQHLADVGLLMADAEGLWHTPFDAATEDYRELPLPPSVRDAVLARVQRLAEPVQRVLDAASLAVEPFAAGLLAPACALSEVEAALALEAALDARLLREHEGGGWTFVHDLVPQALASALGAARRRSVHRRLALGAAAAGRPPAEVAIHHESGGEPLRAVRWRGQAAQAAFDLHALDEAVTHWRQACDDGAEGDERLAIGCALVRALELRGLYDTAQSEAAAMLALLRAGAGGQAARADALIAVAGLSASRDAYDDALARLADLPAALDERQQAAVHRVRSKALRGLGRLDESAQAAQTALAMRALADDDRARLLDALTMTAMAAGRLRDALGHVEAALALSRALGDGWGTARAMVRRATMLVHLDDSAVAEAALNEAADLTGRMGMTGQQRATLFNLCALHSAQSRPEQVLAVARRSWDLKPPMPLEGLRTQLRLAFVEAHVALGDLGQAWSWQLGAIDDALALRQFAGLAAVVGTGLELLTLLGESARVAPVLAAMQAPALAQMHHYATEMHLVQAECALLDADVDGARHHLASLAGTVEDPRVQVRQRIAQAALCVAVGDPVPALAGLPSDDAPGHNAELRVRALAVRVAAEAAHGGLSDRTAGMATTALAADRVHAVAELLLHHALRRAGSALDPQQVSRVTAMAGSLQAHPAQRLAFEQRWL